MNFAAVPWVHNDITQLLKVVTSYIITSYLAGDYFHGLRHIIAPAAPMVPLILWFSSDSLKTSLPDNFCDWVHLTTVDIHMTDDKIKKSFAIN